MTPLLRRRIPFRLLAALYACFITILLPLTPANAYDINKAKQSIAALNSISDMESSVDGFFSTSGHTNNWAVLVCSSRFWFNYRHIANTLSIYRTVKRLGIPDSNIILMLSDDVACNPRNPFPATVYNDASKNVDLYGENIEVDYRGYEVTVENVIRLLTGRQDDSTPPSKRLLTDDRSNILVYFTGHGGEEFLKFQDQEEISSQDIADAFEQMWQKKRYHEIFFMIDTCQANSMFLRFYSPNILATGSSRTGENSYSHHLDPEIGVAVIDRFTYYNLETLEKISKTSLSSLNDLFNTYNPDLIHSHPGVRSDLFHRDLKQTLITDFFGGVQNVELTVNKYYLPEPKEVEAPKVSGKREQVKDATTSTTIPNAMKKLERIRSLPGLSVLSSKSESQSKLGMVAGVVLLFGLLLRVGGGSSGSGERRR